MGVITQHLMTSQSQCHVDCLWSGLIFDIQVASQTGGLSLIWSFSRVWLGQPREHVHSYRLNCPGGKWITYVNYYNGWHSSLTWICYAACVRPVAIICVLHGVEETEQGCAVHVNGPVSKRTDWTACHDDLLIGVIDWIVLSILTSVQVNIVT